MANKLASIAWADVQVVGSTVATAAIRDAEEIQLTQVWHADSKMARTGQTDPPSSLGVTTVRSETAVVIREGGAIPSWLKQIQRLHRSRYIEAEPLLPSQKSACNPAKGPYIVTVLILPPRCNPICHLIRKRFSLPNPAVPRRHWRLPSEKKAVRCGWPLIRQEPRNLESCVRTVGDGSWRFALT